MWEGPCSGSAFSGRSLISQSITIMTSPSLNADLALIPVSVPVTCPGWSCDFSFISVSVYTVKLFKHRPCLLADFALRAPSPALSVQYTKQNTLWVEEFVVYSLHQWCRCCRVKREGQGCLTFSSEMQRLVERNNMQSCDSDTPMFEVKSTDQINFSKHFILQDTADKQ